MKPAAFEYHRPRTIDDALALLSEVGEDGKILAGGQSLVPLMNFRLAQPAHVIDINFIGGLDHVRSENGQVKIGCLARQSQALEDPLIRQRCPLSPMPWLRSAIRKPAIAAQFAAVWRTPILLRNYPPCCWHWMAW